MVSFNSGGSGSGQFSTLSELIDDALREMGESSPTVLKNLESERFLNYANRVVADINRHPSFLDVLDNTYDDQTGSISSGSNDLVVTSGTVTFSTYTPVKIAGAGASNSDLHSYYSIDDTDTNNTGLITLRSGIYTNTLNNWIGSITNIQGALTVEINEYT